MSLRNAFLKIYASEVFTSIVNLYRKWNEGIWTQ